MIKNDENGNFIMHNSKKYVSRNAKNTEILVEKEEGKKEKVLEMSIEELDLSVRSYNCLKRA